MSRRFVILGAGISGLAVGLFLKQHLTEDDTLTIIEKSDRTGGWIRTIRQDGFLFEQGPRSCRTRGTGSRTLALAESLHLTDRIVLPDAKAAKRYVLHRNRLCPLPQHWWQIPFNPLTSDWLQALRSDLKNPKRESDDESIETFFRRRLGSGPFENLVDPFVSGIYAGDCSRLSLKSCFPACEEWEQTKGSLLKGCLMQKKVPNDSPERFRNASLFSFSDGMETLPGALTERLRDCIKFRTTVQKPNVHSDRIEIVLDNGETIQATHLISALPAEALSPLFPELAPLLDSIRYATVVTVNFGYDEKVLHFDGFGYLIPSGGNSPVLGCVWDSSVFPMHNISPEQTRLSVMLGGMKHPDIANLSEEALISTAAESVKKDLGITIRPKAVRVHKAVQAIPQYHVGYSLLKKNIYAGFRSISPRISVIGSAFSGVSVNDCIAHAELLARSLLLESDR